MKTPPLQMVPVLHLMGIVIGASQVSSLLINSKKVPLNMSFGSFDDQYKDCDPGLEAKLKDPIHTDFANRGDYAEVWRAATSRWNTLSRSVTNSLKPEYGTAVVAYTHQSNLYSDFNRAVREAGQNYAHFTFKSFHFLLTRALQVLKASQPTCYTVYRGIRNIHFTVSDPSKPVRFGQFASSSLKKATAQNKYGSATFFTIKTCLGINISRFSFSSEDEEVLIPPYEKFLVTEFREEDKTTHIHLRSDGLSSFHNCGFVKAAGPSRLSANSPVLFLLSGFLLVTGTLGSPDVL